MTDLRTTWETLLLNIRPKVSEANYNSWIKQVKFLESNDQKIKLGAPNSFVQDWIIDYYHDLIVQELYSLTKKTFELEFEITGEEDLDPKQVQPFFPAERTTPKMKGGDITGRLNKKYSFERFVVGTSNQFAHAASLATADLPGGNYNPLFIYGGPGLGKTHLLTAIGLKIAEKFPELRILYLSAEEFTNELIFSIRFEKMDQFRKKYREGCDVFLVDDFQFIIGKERTVEEFFHTFNVLYGTQRQIAVTCDRPPKELDGLEERLRSRFDWGLIADIQPPDLETRIAILKKKADQSGIVLSDDVALFLASQIKSNVRELEGALIRLSAFASLGGKEVSITVDFAKEVLKNIIRERAASCSIEAIQRAVADFYHMKSSELKSARRLKSISTPRQIAMYLCREHLDASYPEIGHKFGGKDHSTVIHAVKKISTLLERDDGLKRDMEIIEKMLVQ